MRAIGFVDDSSVAPERPVGHMAPPRLSGDVLAAIEKTLIVSTGNGELAAYAVRFLEHVSMYAPYGDGKPVAWRVERPRRFGGGLRVSICADEAVAHKKAGARGRVVPLYAAYRTGVQRERDAQVLADALMRLDALYRDEHDIEALDAVGRPWWLEDALAAARRVRGEV